MSDRPVLIANPKSGAGLDERALARLVKSLAAELGELDLRYTERRGHAIGLAAEEARAGRRLIVAVGGDGTVSEVVNGILEGTPAGDAASRPALGIIPRGTGGDFRRTLDVPTDPAQAAATIRKSPGHAIDLGRVTFQTPEGAPSTRAYVNVASFGFSSAVADRANRSSKALGGKLSYLGATVRTLVTHENPDLWIEADGAPRVRRRLLLGVVGNGRCFGGGMRICPGAKLDDGTLELVLVGDFGRLEVLRHIARLYDGTHVSLPDVTAAQVKRVVVTPVDDTARVPVELDGETPGFLPATFEVLPRALTLRF